MSIQKLPSHVAHVVINHNSCFACTSENFLNFSFFYGLTRPDDKQYTRIMFLSAWIGIPETIDRFIGNCRLV